MGAYIAIDLKSFYASVECVERGLDPLGTNLVVADESRTEKTICLAVTPSLKAYGIPGRARLFEVMQKVEEVNRARLRRAGAFRGESFLAEELHADPGLKLSFIAAPPRMAKYMEISTKIFHLYMRYVAPEDIHVYSIDEVFIDAAGYLKTYRCTARELAMRMIRDVLRETGITATAGIGTNLYLAKIAMDIVAKHMPADENGVRIAELDEMTYRRQLWSHRPITDFWRVGKGIARKLETACLYTMGDVARASEYNEKKLYQMFGVNAELLIDHAWGWEPCRLQDIKAYRPATHSLSQGQVLPSPYSFEQGKLIVREMAEQLVLDLVRKGLEADQMVLTVGYDHTGIPEGYEGALERNHYGKTVPKMAHGSVNLGRFTASAKRIVEAVVRLYAEIVDRRLLVRRMYVVANHVLREQDVPREEFVQLDMFTDPAEQQRRHAAERQAEQQEKSLQKAILAMQQRYGRNAVLKGMNLREGATAITRNGQVGGHRA